MKNKLIHEIGELVLRCEKVLANEWELLAFVFDLRDGAISNSGFLYNADKVRPASAGIEDAPLLLDNKIVELQRVIQDECGEQFKQILIQMEKSTQKIKIDFEFDGYDRWSFKPSNYAKIKAEIKPAFN